MSSGVVKTVEVKDLGDGRFEILYKGFENKLYQLIGMALFIAAVPTCPRRLNSDPPRRLNSDPGMEAGSEATGCE